ncbi:permease [Spirochaeta isovalerica]|uniref:Permease n=1 Tax=Spirochaeta isovalerica TaxID=150 RepID=A0A841RD75_9SPIO|nr:permease [Spirochaeta isovalerica]MBB6481187.1 hypothetical protein [Spirochaeta isovalerica]
MFEIIKNIGSFMLSAYSHSWPYLLLTIPLAVIINVSGISRYIGRAFSAKPLMAIFLAAAIGAFSPFCSCGVIPVITSLLIGGVPLAPVMSFWLASPSMDPEVFFLSVSRLGMDLAVWRLGATFAMSLAGGYAVYFLMRNGWLSRSVLRASAIESTPVGGGTCSETSCSTGNCSATSCSESAPSCHENSCAAEAKSTNRKVLLKSAAGESGKAIIMIIKFMTLAFFLEALIVLYVPQQWIIGLLGQHNRYSIPLSTLIGIPLYTTNISALGLTGGLLKQGMNPGAALAFLIGGATTTIPAMAAVFGIVRHRVFAVYLLTTMASAALSGFLYQILH